MTQSYEIFRYIFGDCQTGRRGENFPPSSHRSGRRGREMRSLWTHPLGPASPGKYHPEGGSRRSGTSTFTTTLSTTGQRGQAALPCAARAASEGPRDRLMDKILAMKFANICRRLRPFPTHQNSRIQCRYRSQDRLRRHRLVTPVSAFRALWAVPCCCEPLHPLPGPFPHPARAVEHLRHRGRGDPGEVYGNRYTHVVAVVPAPTVS